MAFAEPCRAHRDPRSYSLYNLDKPDVGPRPQRYLLVNSAMMQGFIIRDYGARFAEGVMNLAQWLVTGKLKYAETVVEGFENTPKAFIGLFSEDNLENRSRISSNLSQNRQLRNEAAEGEVASRFGDVPEPCAVVGSGTLIAAAPQTRDPASFRRTDAPGLHDACSV